MGKAAQSSISSDKWETIRDFSEKEDGYTWPKYEAKFIEDVGKQYIEDEIVLLKETNSFGGEQMYYIPREALECLLPLLQN